jgi:HEAT repeat protein
MVSLMARHVARYVFSLASVLFVLAGTAVAQVEGRLYLDKTSYLVGEPIYLNFELTNKGNEPVLFSSGNSYSFCGGYEIYVSTGLPPPNQSCLGGEGGSCISIEWALAPGEIRKDKVLVNFEHDLSKPGQYTVHSSRTLPYRSPNESLPSMADEAQVKIEAEFEIQVAIGSDEALVPMFQPFLADLGSKNEKRQIEAARVIGSLAPTFLEDTILSMVNSPVTRPYALIGLRHLNTARSRARLASFVQDTPDYSYDKEQAIKDLSEMADAEYFPLLLAEAKKWMPNQARDYVLAAARLGGEVAMPYVVSLLGSSDPFSRGNALMALPETGSRQAVPLLIQALKDPNADSGRLASLGLIQLTHRSPFEDGRIWGKSPSAEYRDWTRWWYIHSSDAAIYKPSECGAVEQLK